jgi:hypothetical protein
MNPRVSLQCASRVFAALVVMATLLAAMGCGSGLGLTHPLPGGFSNASLNGKYVIAQTGIGVNQAGTAADSFSEVIVFTADGNGNLTVAVDDFNQSNATFEDTNLTGSYSISRDGRGSLRINFTTGSANYAITMIDDSHFYVIEQDLGATASGYGEKQTATSMPTGNFVFKSHNTDTFSRVGGISITNGAISGTEDRLNIGSLSSNAISSTAAMTTPDANGRGTFTLNDGTAFFYYVVSAAKFRFLSNIGTLEIGQAETQSGTFSLATLASGNSYVFGSAGDTVANGQSFVHSGGVFTTDGAGNIASSGTALAVDSVEDAIAISSPVSGGTYTLASNGRGQLNLTLSNGFISPLIFWMVDSTHAYFLVDSTTALEDGTFTLQQGAPFSAIGGQAAFVMDGFDGLALAYKDRVGAFQPTTSGNFNWNQASNAFDPSTGIGQPLSAGTNGTYTASPNGRVTVTVNGVTNTPNAWVFYLSSASSGVMVLEDANIGGAFTVQASQ